MTLAQIEALARGEAGFLSGTGPREAPGMDLLLAMGSDPED